MSDARDFFDNLSETLMAPQVHTSRACKNRCCRVATPDHPTLLRCHNPKPCADHPRCHICLNPVTDSQLADGDAYVKDSAGNADGEYEHRECGQGAKYERE